MKRFLTCIVCPMGCKIEAEITDGKIEYIKKLDYSILEEVKKCLSFDNIAIVEILPNR